MIPREKLLEAVKKAKETPKRRFSQSIDLTINLKDLDMSKPENRISEEVLLPHGVGEPLKVVVFAEGELAKRSRDAGADLVIGREELEALRVERKRAKRVAEEYHALLAQADLMPLIGKLLGPVLGPRGKMPKPVPPTADPRPLIERYRKTVFLRARDQPVLHLRVGVDEMLDEQLADNIQAVLEVLERRLERGLYHVDSIVLKTTMGKPVRMG